MKNTHAIYPCSPNMGYVLSWSCTKIFIVTSISRTSSFTSICRISLQAVECWVFSGTPPNKYPYSSLFRLYTSILYELLPAKYSHGTHPNKYSLSSLFGLYTSICKTSPFKNLMSAQFILLSKVYLIFWITTF